MERLTTSSWHSRLIVCLAALALVVSLASRTFEFSSDPHTAARSGVVEGKRQHLDRDVTNWTAPVAAFVSPQWRPVMATIPPASEPLIAVDRDSCLYNRPPPLSC